MTIFAILLSALLARPVESCWTFLHRPACTQQQDAWTCCDVDGCFTFETEPECWPFGEAFVCCG